MNSTNLLLGMTCLLLVVGFALSFGDFTQSRGSNADRDEIAELRAEIERMDAEDHALELSRLRQLSPLPTITAPVVADPLPIAPSAPKVDPLAEQMKDIISTLEEKNQELEDEKEELEDEKEQLMSDKETLEAENEDIFEERVEERKQDSMAAFRVKNALTLGTVTSADKTNALVIFTPASSQNFQPGRILAVRRNTGIVGQIEIDRLASTGEYVASMRPHGYSPDNYPDIQVGDTIIIDIKG